LRIGSLNSASSDVSLGSTKPVIPIWAPLRSTWILTGEQWPWEGVYLTAVTRPPLGTLTVCLKGGSQS
jgi:hypothetical protein